MMFGDVGGLYDCLILIFTGFFSAYAHKLKTLALIKALFFSESRKRTPHLSNPTGLGSLRVRKLSFSNNFTWLFACSLSFCKCGDRKQKKFVKVGIERLDKSLDLVRLVRKSRAFVSLSRILLSRSERRLLLHQKEDSVLRMKQNS